MDLVAGVDVGTSGVRGLAVDPKGKVVAEASRRLPAPVTDGAKITQDPHAWWEAVAAVLAQLAEAQPGRIAAVAVDGTSGTMLLVDRAGRPTGPVRMYNDGSGAAHAGRIREVAPLESGAHGATSPLAWLMVHAAECKGAVHAVHQADWLLGRLCGRHGISDDNNALKTGWDPVGRHWPEWIESLGVHRSVLPGVVEPGTVVGEATTEIGLPEGCLVVAGTTDGCAAFLATGADKPGDGVTSLGTTLTLKLLADKPMFDAHWGVYSHRLLGMWLTGGASNTGGAALAKFFTPEAMAKLEPKLKPEQPTGLDFYPLPRPGERFPINDPIMASREGPRPEDDAQFLQALLEGIAQVEALGYRRMTELGAPKLKSVRTVGGGAANKAWKAIRARELGVPLVDPLHAEAAYGAARLARYGLDNGG